MSNSNIHNNRNNRNNKKRYIKSNAIKKKTFLILSDYIDSKIVEKMFNNKYWKPSNIKLYKNKKNKEKYVDFIYTDGKKSSIKYIWDIKSNVYNTLSDSAYVVTDKKKLYNNFKKLHPKLVKKYMMEQYSVDILNKKDIELLKLNKFKNIFKNNSTWILKPVIGYKGHGIKVVNNYNDMMQHFNNNLYKKDHTHYLSKYIKKDSNPWVIAKYIDNPLLYGGKKFHIRMNIMYFVINNDNKLKNKVIKKFLFKDGSIIRAKKNYKKNNYENKDIHDTHHIIDYELDFIDEFTKEFGLDKTNKVLKEIKKITDIIFKILDINNANCYPNTINCFNVFGLDIMVDDNFNVKLLECNYKPSLALIKNNIKEYFENIIDIVMKNIYPNDI